MHKEENSNFSEFYHYKTFWTDLLPDLFLTLHLHFMLKYTQQIVLLKK